MDNKDNNIKDSFWDSFSKGKVLEKYLYGNDRLALGVGRFVIAIFLIIAGLALLLGITWIIFKFKTAVLIIGSIILVIMFWKGLG